MSQFLDSQASFTSSQGSIYYAADPPPSSTPLFQRFPILQYIEECGLPPVHARGKVSLQKLDKQLPYTIDWPMFYNLKRPSGDRLLRQVISQDPPNDLARRVKTYLRQFTLDKQQQQHPVEGEFDLFLQLPCKNFKLYDDDDKAFLSNLQNEDDFIRIMQQFVLGTISELVRVMERLPIKSPLAQDLKFKISNRLCPAHHARWDLFTLPPDIHNNIPLLVVFVPPWHFGHKDMDQFASVQKFAEGVLDALDTKLHSASDIVWAIIYDILKDKGRRFIVTNYNRWVCGSLSQDYTMARTTQVYQADFLYDAFASPDIYKGCSVVELLVYWMQEARGRIPNAY